MPVVKTILILTLLFILYQDTAHRFVYWFLFPIVGMLCGFLFFSSTSQELFLSSVLMNLAFVGILLLALFLYTRFKLKSSVLKAIGSGDIWLFLGLSFSCATISFMVLFIAALFFSLILHLVIRKIKAKSNATVPLAGYMGLFFAVVYLSHWFGTINNIYSI